MAKQFNCMNITSHITALKDTINFCRTNQVSTVYHALPAPPADPAAFLDYWQQVPKTSHDTFKDASPFALMHYPESECRFLLSQFEPEKSDDFFMLPQRIDDTWKLMAELLTAQQPAGVAVILPPHWQMAPMAYRTSREIKIPMASLRHTNIPLAVNVVKEMEAEVIVTTPDAIAALWPEFVKAGLESLVKAWLVVVPFSQKATVPKVSGEVHFEHHIFPGIPVGIHKGEGPFTPYSEYFFETDEQHQVVTISSLVPHAFPLVRYVPARTLSLANADL